MKSSASRRALALTPELVRQLGFRRVPKSDFMEAHGVTLSEYRKPGTYVFEDFYSAKPLPDSKVRTAAKLVAGLALRIRLSGAQVKALTLDLADMRGRFCDHHGTPGAVGPGCPECERLSLRKKLPRSGKTAKRIG